MCDGRILSWVKRKCGLAGFGIDENMGTDDVFEFSKEQAKKEHFNAEKARLDYEVRMGSLVEANGT